MTSAARRKHNAHHPRKRTFTGKSNMKKIYLIPIRGMKERPYQTLGILTLGTLGMGLLSGVIWYNMKK